MRRKRNWIRFNFPDKVSLNFETKPDVLHSLEPASSWSKNIDTNQSRESQSDSNCYRDNSRAIYDLISTGGMTSTHPPDEAQAHDLIRSLYSEYWRALQDPHAPLGVEWAMPATSDHRSLSGSQFSESSEAESIEALLSSTRSVEAIFGSLAAGDAPDPSALTGAPEILRLFAPPEFKARGSRLPPTLVRREHHTVGIDSPLPTQASQPSHLAPVRTYDCIPVQTAILEGRV